MADDQMVLVNKETGAELVFTSRAEYLAVKYSGGWRDKKSGESGSARPQEPRPVRRETPRREPVNDAPTVETARSE